MKRVLLIAGGTLGGLGAVLAITPPQLGSTSGSASGGISAPGALATRSAAPAATAKATTKATAKATAKATVAPAQTKSAAPAPVVTSKGTNGTFTGTAVDVRYGLVQVKITVANGKITDAQAVQAPTGRNDRYTQMAVPVLRQRTLAAQSADIQGVSGASYTSFGWYTSLVNALSQAGL